MADVPAYVSRKRGARELDMSPDTWDDHVRKGVLPPPKKRGKLKRWKWSEVEAALEADERSGTVPPDEYDLGVERAFRHRYQKEG